MSVSGSQPSLDLNRQARQAHKVFCAHGYRCSSGQRGRIALSSCMTTGGSGSDGWVWGRVRPAGRGALVTLTAVAVAGGGLKLFHGAPVGVATALIVIAAYAAIAYLTGWAHAEPSAGDFDGGAHVAVGTRDDHADRPAPSEHASGDASSPPTAAAGPVDRGLQAGASPAPGRAARERQPGTPAIVVSHLTKRFGERIAFEDVSFSVEAGEVFGFLGPNGAGKTTTVRTLGTLVAPSSGSAEVAGIPVTPENGVEIRRRISIMPEVPGLYLRLSVTENLEFFAGLYGVRDPGARVAQALDAVNLGGRARDLAGSLSKGLRQRVGLARALLNEPEIIFLDEPTSGLDPVAAREVHELINGMRQRGVTIFLTTHRLEEAELLCDRVAILNTTLRTVGQPDKLRHELFSTSLVVRTATPLDAPDHVFSPVGGVEGWHADSSGAYVLTVSDPRSAAPEVTRALVAAGADVLSIAESRHTLEDVYLELVSDDVEAHAR